MDESSFGVYKTSEHDFTETGNGKPIQESKKDKLPLIVFHALFRAMTHQFTSEFGLDC